MMILFRNANKEDNSKLTGFLLYFKPCILSKFILIITNWQNSILYTSGCQKVCTMYFLKSIQQQQKMSRSIISLPSSCFSIHLVKSWKVSVGHKNKKGSSWVASHTHRFLHFLVMKNWWPCRMSLTEPKKWESEGASSGLYRLCF